MSETSKEAIEDATAAADDGVEVIDQVPFGQVLVAEGFAPRDEVELAAKLQTQLAGRGVFLRLGELLVARGVVSEETVEEVLRRQGTHILVCPKCMAQYNVLIYSRSKTYRCARCRGELAVPAHISEVSVEDTLVHSDLEIDVEDLAQGSGRPFGNYVILGQISRGGMGIIYKARQKGLDRVVAMKVLARGEGAGGAPARAFLEEAKAVAALRHPNIVAIYDVGQLGGVHYYTMDYIEGLPLHRAATAEGLSEREIAAVFVKLCDAVDYAHSRGLIHRDIKPQNVLLSPQHVPVLIDFGIAGKVGEQQAEAQIVGSPAYLPPEVITGEAGYGIRGDVYALGASLYSILSGRPPHTGIDTVALLRRASVEDVVPLRQVRRSVDPELARIVMTAIQRNPEDRYATAGALADDLRRWLSGEDVVAGQSPLVRAWQRVRGKVAATFGLTLALVLLSVSSSSALILHQARQEEEATRVQYELQLQGLGARLVEERLQRAELLLQAGRPADAAALLTKLLQEERIELPGRRIYTLRALARDALGQSAGAAQDRAAAERLGR